MYNILDYRYFHYRYIHTQTYINDREVVFCVNSLLYMSPIYRKIAFQETDCFSLGFILTHRMGGSSQDNTAECQGKSYSRIHEVPLIRDLTGLPALNSFLTKQVVTLSND
jgi:hypothetical protein